MIRSAAPFEAETGSFRQVSAAGARGVAQSGRGSIHPSTATAAQPCKAGPPHCAPHPWHIQL